MSFSTPVVFLIFNRPDLTKLVFRAIAKARPKHLFVIADGPRFPEEVQKCQETRSIVNRVDWDCEILTDFSQANLGGPKRISSGLDWVFSQVDEAIILEDDCLPSPSFFRFCQVLLERYRNDKRVMQISGNDFLFNNYHFRGHNVGGSYYFTRYAFNWGWATWQRAWKHFDLRIKTWPDFKKFSMGKVFSYDPEAKGYFIPIFDKVHNGEAVHWDFRNLSMEMRHLH